MEAATRRRITRGAAVAGVLALGALEAALGVWAERSATIFPEVAHLGFPVLAASVGVCGAGQLCLVLLITAGRAGRRVVVALLAAMAIALVGIERFTTAHDATPPAVALACWGGAAVCAALAAIVATRRQAMTPAARAGSA